MKQKKIPYGLSDFKRVKTENYYYIDKTRFIPLVEDDADFLFFLRPRRFGKSLLINMLIAYFDIHYKDEFEEIFKDTWILNNQTPLKSSFYILKFDFSAVDITRYEESFRTNIALEIKYFIKKYNLDIKLPDNDPLDNLRDLFRYIKEKDLPLYIFIDEYDNFANKLLASNIANYKNIVTDKTASYKEFFTMLKAGTSDNDSAIKKMFFTGVTPVALYDVSSGSNIGKNVSLLKSYNDMVGITKDELKDMISYYNFEDKKQSIIKRCDDWYNNYRFSLDTTHTIYNSDMILYYFDYLIKTDAEPKNLIDTNVRTDYSKLKFLIYMNKKLNGNFELLNKLIVNEDVVTSDIKDNFSAFELTNSENFKSFLFSLGFMNLNRYRVSAKLQIPNQTIKKLLSEFIDFGYKSLDNYNFNTDEFNNQLLDLAYDKNLSCFHYLANVISTTSSLRDYIDGENFIKAYMLAYLNLNNFYEVYSEREFEKGFVDILLEKAKDEVPYGVMIELKYLKKEDNDTILEQKIQDAKNQLIKYDKGDNYIKIIIVFKRWEMVYCEELQC
ncbi:MAG: AAA family ATPase [Campylobacterales bacterium]